MPSTCHCEGIDVVACAGMDEQKVDAMIAASAPQLDPPLTNNEQFPTLGSQPAAPVPPLPAAPPPASLDTASQQPVPHHAAQVFIQLFISL